jgi:RNA polymerase sigma-70 factor (ECF subfamily)
MDPARRAWPQSAEQELALVERLRAGDEGAFETFASVYLSGLLRFAQRRLDGDRELSQEVVQSTVCKVLQNLDSYRGDAALFTWLCACCRNEIGLHHRRLSRRPREVALEPAGRAVDSVELADTAPAASPEDRLHRIETAEAVHAALDLLPPAYARAVEWRYLEGLGVGEIATRLELSYKAAESLLTRGRNAFREVYERLTESAATDENDAVSSRRRVSP